MNTSIRYREEIMKFFEYRKVFYESFDAENPTFLMDSII